jgi:predicted AAA+ superfamily ATPase
MKRDIYPKLMTWKTAGRRKPLILQGARQTGKTYILRKFGKTEYESVLYCNFEENSDLDQFFHRDLNPTRIISELSVYLNQQIKPETGLVIFDEVQTSNRALNSLKYFAEQRPDIHIAAAGSLLGIKLSAPGSFPVGKVNFLYLYPMTFLEFLDAMGEERYRQLLERTDRLYPVADAFHTHLTGLLHRYYFVGGMPEAVEHYADPGNIQEVREIQKEIVKSYILDFAKHAPTPDIPKLSLLWDSIPKHLARENKKFIFSAVKKGARARSYENAVIWLEDAGLIQRSNAVQRSRHPLKHYADTNCFKVYNLDVGLLGAMANTPVEMMAQGERLFNEYEGAFVENFVAQQLAAHLNHPLYYWRSKGGKAELDFLLEIEDRIYPLEVKAGINFKSKSLKSYDVQFTPDLLVRTSLLNFKHDGKVCNIPLYAISELARLLQTASRPPGQ